MTAHLPTHVIARHWAKSEHVDEVRDILLSLIAPTRAEAGCQKYDLFQNATDPTEFTFVEIFADDAALDAHASAPYIKAIPERLRGLIARPSNVSRHRPISSV